MIDVRQRRFLADKPGAYVETYTVINNQPHRFCSRCGRRNTVRYRQTVGTYICRDCQLADPDYVKGTVMARRTYAGEKLAEQVAQAWPDAEITDDGVDGFGVYRKMSFDEVTSGQLYEALTAGAMDERIASAVLDSGVLTLTFQSRSVVADQRGAFELSVEAAPKMAAAVKPDSDEPAPEAPGDGGGQASGKAAPRTVKLAGKKASPTKRAPRKSAKKAGQ